MTRYVPPLCLAAAACLGCLLSELLPALHSVLLPFSRWVLAAALLTGLAAAASHGYEAGRPPARVRVQDSRHRQVR